MPPDFRSCSASGAGGRSISRKANRTFILSLRGWEDVLWGVRIHPCDRHRLPKPPRPSPYEEAHVMMSRREIERFLRKLVLLDFGV